MLTISKLHGDKCRRLFEFVMLPLVLHVVVRRGVSAFTAGPGWTTVSLRNSRSLTVSQRFLSKLSLEDEPSDNLRKKSKRKSPTPKRFKVNTKTTPDQSEKLAAAFEEFARKEGFGSGEAHFADNDSFEDDSIDDDFDLGVAPVDFDDVDVDDNSDENDVFGTDEVSGDGSIGDSMAERISAAKRDIDLGRVTVPEDLDRLARDASAQTLRDLGFKRELDPFGNDETPRKQRLKIVADSMSCSACGSDFQCRDDKRPGYLPPEKFEVQQKLSKIEEMRKLRDKDIEEEWSTDDEIEWLIQTSGKENGATSHRDVDLDAVAEEMGIKLDKYAGKKVICKRCHSLQNFGQVDSVLRPGWSDDPLLAQERFRALLRPISTRKAVIIALVDLFDFSGSVLPELDSIAGSNPVIIAANKADLLPSKMGLVRAQNWVRRELEYLGVKSLANVGGAVRLVSCKTGMGIFPMLAKARELADEMDCDIYLVGAANAGKSTMLNYILQKDQTNEGEVRKKRAGNQNFSKGAVTASPLPGTTLKFIKVELDGGRNLYDTPGLLVPGTLTQMLTPEELKVVVPTKKVQPVTFRVASGKCVLIGGLARVAIVDDSKPFLLTFFVANDIKIHPTDMAKSDDFRREHAGGLLTPPLPPGRERIDELGEFEHHFVEIEGKGWSEAAADISLTGLGWIAVTGPGRAKVQISVPKGISVSVRPPLMPLDVWDSTARYTGGRSVRAGKGRKGIGRN